MDKYSAMKLLEDTFHNSFSEERFSLFAKELFNKFEISPKTWNVWKEYWEYIDSYQLLGSYKQGKHVIDILAVKLKKSTSIERARTMQRNFVAKYLGNAEKDAAFVAFYYEGEPDWRFSFVKMEYRLKEGDKGKVKVEKELTPAKRYSFLVGKNEPNHTCKSQFLELVMDEGRQPSLEDIEAAFSIEKVTKEFFNEYKNLYLELEESLVKVLEKDPRTKKEFEEKGITSVDFSKKLLGQIVFIYFLQKKGWLGVARKEKDGFQVWGSGPKNFLRKLFDKEIVPYDNFFNDILEPLFYEALAEDRTANDDYYSRFNCKIPFLNGGLFEPIGEYNWTGTDIILDNSIFQKILDTFDRYNFTIKEDEPLEKEVAIDPEMLGKVFENLLEVKDRKSKGSYYTPREIVHYMCQQSLINYLETNTEISREDIEKFVQFGEFTNAKDERQLIRIKEINEEMIHSPGKVKELEKEIKRCIDALTLPNSIIKDKNIIDFLLKNVKIVDPAVGSGAFPVGMMAEIVKARSVLTPFFPEDERRERTDYNLKRETIENCLYGVDIDSSAIDITKLRFWLSLIVDELDMKNIKPLPNLDHKIMVGNSLLEEFEGVKLFDESLLGEIKKNGHDMKQIDEEMKKLYLERREIHESSRKVDDLRIKEIKNELKKLEKKKRALLVGPKDDSGQATLQEALSNRIKQSRVKLVELKKLQKRFFNAQDRKLKKQYSEQINRIEWELIEETLKEQGNEDAMKKLKQYQKSRSKPFFLWKLYFAEVFQRENPGFDIVIANPPYIQLQKTQEDTEKLERSGYKTFTRTGDIYALFYERGINLLKRDGVLTYISSNTWMRAKFGEKLREFLIARSDPKIIINFEDRQIFSSATVETCITIIKNKEFTNHLIGVSFKRDFVEFGTISDYVKQKSVILDNLSSGPWIIIPREFYKIKEKIEKNGTRIKQWHDIKFFRGILTGFNDAFFIDEKIKSDLIKMDSKSGEIIKSLIRGRHIGRYFYRTENLWIIFSKHGINIEKYHSIKKHLSKYKNRLEPRPPNLDTDKKWEGRKTGKYKWYEIQDNTAYYRDFGKEKIIWLAITDKPKFALDTGSFVTAPAYFMTSNCNRYLLALLNSKVSEWYLDKVTSSTGQGTNQWSKIYVEQIPIPILNKNDQEPIIKLVEQILAITKDKDYLENPEKQTKVKKLEKEIDQFVYKLYGLTEEEIKIVEGNG